MSGKGFLHPWLAILSATTILALPAGGLLFTFLLSLHDTQIGSLGNPAGLTNYSGILHTYLFRNAVINTLLLILLVVPLSVWLGFVLARALVSLPGGGHIFIALLLMPLLVPPGVVALAWRLPFAGAIAMRETYLALSLTGIVLLWRTLPLATGILLYVGSEKHRWAPCQLATIAVIGLVLSDIGAVLMLTGGEPANTAHSWASWLFQNSWVIRNWGQAAAMALALSTALGFVAMGLVWITSSQSMGCRWLASTTGYTSRRSTLMVLLAGAFILAPALFALQSAAVAPLSGYNMLRNTGAIRWLENSLLVVTGTTLLASLLVLIAAPQVAHLASRMRAALCAACLVIGISIYPIWFFPLSRLQSDGALHDSRLALCFTFVTTVAAVSLWPSTVIWRQTSWQRRKIWRILGLVSALSLLVVLQDFGNSIVVNRGSQMGLIGSGIALYLARATPTPSALPLAILFTIGLAALFSMVLVRVLAALRQSDSG